MGSETRELKAYEDVPLCPTPDRDAKPCNGPLVTRAEHPRGADYWLTPEARLICLACGAGHTGTDEEVAQAEHARDAWQEEKARQDAETFREQIATLDARHREVPRG